MLPALGVGLILSGTWRYGIAVSPDSVSYLSAARSFAHGKGFILYDGSPMLAWPPLYPFVLALGEPLGADLLHWALGVNLLCYILLFIVCAVWSGRLHSRYTRVVFLIAAALSPLTLDLHCAMLSEPVFMLLTAAWCFAIGNVLALRRHALFAATLIAALACLQRYIGVTLVLSGGLLLLFTPGFSLRRRLLNCTIYSSALLPAVAWTLRNYALSGTLTSERIPTAEPFLLHLVRYAGGLAQWIAPLPDSVRERLPILAAAQVLVCLILLAALAMPRHARMPFPRHNLSPYPMILFIVVYSLWLVASASRVAFDEIADRLLSPLFIPLLMTIALAADRILSGTANSAIPVARVLKLAAPFWLAALVTLSAARTAGRWSHGAGYFQSPRYRNSELLQALRQNYPQQRVFSNMPDVIYFFTGHAAERTPQNNELARLAKAAQTGPVCLVHSRLIDFRPNLAQPEEIMKTHPIKLLRHYADGDIYQLTAQAE